MSPFTSHSHDIMQTVSRYYSNAFTGEFTVLSVLLSLLWYWQVDESLYLFIKGPARKVIVKLTVILGGKGGEGA